MVKHFHAIALLHIAMLARAQLAESPPTPPLPWGMWLRYERCHLQIRAGAGLTVAVKAKSVGWSRYQINRCFE